MYYPTQQAAQVIERFMTAIETCRAAEANPFDDMMAVVRNLETVKLDPGGWMPWNYLDTIAQAAPRAPEGVPTLADRPIFRHQPALPRACRKDSFEGRIPEP